MKVVYFDETAATDYITIQNGGQIDWTTTENKERLAKIIAEIDVQAKGGFNLFSFIMLNIFFHSTRQSSTIVTRRLSSNLVEGI